ncbi:MAG TPA: hypothetical protein VK864_20780 [Longimicrobiales bacterium]|nr:hypothetical protein [Longimicrobiales bacterium]
MSALLLTRLVLIQRARRIGGLSAFAALFLISGITARILVGEGGHVEAGELFLVGGYPLVSALLLLGWLLGRYPLIAALVLLAGVFSDDQASGYARLYSVRPRSFFRIYAPRVLALTAIAFLFSAVLLPIFDVLMLGRWSGPSTLVLIACYVVPYAGLVTLLSVFFRGDAWIALGLGILAMVWDALRRANLLQRSPPGLDEVVSFVLPPQGPLFRIESAFGNLQPIPWTAVWYVLGYGVVLFLAAAVFVGDREL